MRKWHKALVVIIGAIALSTLAIQASDTFQGIENNLSGLVAGSQEVCEKNAVLFHMGDYSLCIDTYEASAQENCPHRDTQSALHTQENANAAECAPASQKEVQPWRFVSLTQAQQLCARVGKRLPTNEEWYKYASGMSDVSMCHIDTKKDRPETTGTASCTTPAGVEDVVGNVWEWVDGQVSEGVYDNRTLPESGYVSLVDQNGVVVTTSQSPLREFGDDYALTESQGLRGIIRGGFYGSGEDAGIYAQNLAVPLDLKTTGVGFRCVKQIKEL